jgi:O-acetyl-ADP-ribose deacetylase (regulator of RNase III)
MHRFRLHSACSLIVQQGDITQVKVDAIVNAANPRMLGGGGVDDAIHLAAGPQLEEACRLIQEVRPDVRCPRGKARITPGFGLPCRFVIHAVGPVYESPDLSAPVLESAYKSALELANQHDIHSIAFPAISCGIYDYPVAEAAEISIRACYANCGDLRESRFVLFGSTTFDAWDAVATKILPPER